MPSGSSLFLSLLLGILAKHCVADTITTCPSAETYVIDNKGLQWSVCANTDYQGPSSQILYNIASDSDCVNICANTAGCSKSVYDKPNKVCHVKANPDTVNWATNTQFDTMHIRQLSSCLTAETTVTDSSGGQWTLCTNSDYMGQSSVITGGIASDGDCVNLCARTAGCTQAVYDKLNKVCHVKNSATTLTWTSNTQFDTLRIVSAAQPAQGSQVTGGKCPYTEQTYTSIDGSQYSICPGTDLRGASIYVVNGYASSQACADLCNQTPVCTNAVYDNQNQVCHIKGDPNGLGWDVDKQFTVIKTTKKATVVPVSPAVGGKWSAPVQLPLVPAHAYVVPQQPTASRLLLFSADSNLSFGSMAGTTQFNDYNYVSGAVSARTVSNTGHDMFCPGISALTDGRVVITGGSDAAVVSIYDPATNNFVRAANMNIPRGYQSSTILSNGKVFTIGGSFTGGIGGKTGEVYDPATNQWTVIASADPTPLLTTDREGAWRTDNHAWLHAWSNGYVFQAGPSKKMHWYGTISGGVTDAGTRDANNDAMCGINIMYDTGKILSAGGSQDYTDSASFSRAHIITIGQPGQAASVQQVANMQYPRGFANGVVLPNGSVLMLGGQRTTRVFTDLDSVLAPELFNPATKAWTTLNQASVARNYHSIAILLGDGTVFNGGGGLCPAGANAAPSCDNSAEHNNFQIFSPPYLFNKDGSAATRPTISTFTTSQTTSGNYVSVGGTLTVTTSASCTFSLIRLGSVTHSTNTDQRRLSLTATSIGTNRYQIKLPTDSGILLPGYWYLFAMNQAGVPSIARVLQVRI